jgi:hypothetical protein
MQQRQGFEWVEIPDCSHVSDGGTSKINTMPRSDSDSGAGTFINCYYVTTSVLCCLCATAVSGGDAACMHLAQ